MRSTRCGTAAAKSSSQDPWGDQLDAAGLKAVRVGDGSYKISGTKIFISAGEHDLAANIIHLVLARIEGAPSGSHGLSLFVVPKIVE